ncbi:hypothetical protein LAZ67_2002808 [Cordylochernes scorpioides]|uniref:DNA helicase Pif1-like 2B domain-containing protein n=1 Tax=Cordylochernes scorpioides TaxID=51811 RepID=A0ABY6K2H0_9ARAC|nr:hypothetical protein LAZ67_2002808 [Cordylochernes scorpioides]
MFWRRNRFTVWRFPPNIASNSKIYGCRLNKRFSQIIDSMKLQLTTNMIVALLNDTSGKDFSEKLLTIGNGRVPFDKSSGLISFPRNFCNFTNLSTKYSLASSLTKKIVELAILAAKNKDVDDLNYIIQNEIIGTMHSFKYIDCVTNADVAATNYPIEFLNSLDLPGLPPHNLRLKVGSIVIMLRNINQPKLCNGTHLVVSEEVLIPRILMIPTCWDFPILPSIRVITKTSKKLILFIPFHN